MNKKTAAFYAKTFKRQHEERDAALVELFQKLSGGEPLYSGPSVTLTFLVADALRAVSAGAPDADHGEDIRPAILGALQAWLDSISATYLATLDRAAVASTQRSFAAELVSPSSLTWMAPKERARARLQLDIAEQTAHPFEYIAMDPSKDWAEHFLERFAVDDYRSRGVGCGLFALMLIWDLWGDGARRIFSFSRGPAVEVEAAIQLGIISRHIQLNLLETDAEFERLLRAEQEAHDVGVLEVRTAISKTSRENGLKGAAMRHNDADAKIAYEFVRDFVLANHGKLNQRLLREALRELQIPMPNGSHRLVTKIVEDSTITGWLKRIRRDANLGRTRTTKN